MTLPSNTQIAVSDINSEIGRPWNYSSDLNFLNSVIRSDQRPGSPNMASFWGKAYFQNNTAGNCNCSNCNCSGDCGNINCNQCAYVSTVNCTNCDSQNWLQANCNCACTYNCNWRSTSYACNCTCACSKIICTKLYRQGELAEHIFQADQEYGEWLKRNDRSVYKGYIRWAKLVTSWMDGGKPDFMVWIKDPKVRSEKQAAAATTWAKKIALPWAEHMAYLMKAVPEDNLAGRITMAIGRPICKIVDMLPKKENPGVGTTWTMWVLFFFTYYVSNGIVKLRNLIKGK